MWMMQFGSVVQAQVFGFIVAISRMISLALFPPGKPFDSFTKFAEKSEKTAKMKTTFIFIP